MDTPNPMFAKFDQVLGKTTPTPTDGQAPVPSRASEIRAIAKPASTENIAPNQTPSFSGLPKTGMGETPDVAAPGTPDTGSIIKNTAKSLVSGTIESGKDIAAAIGGNTMMKPFEKLAESDRNYLTTLIQLRNKNATDGNKTGVDHFNKLIKSYKTTEGPKATDLFPALNKSTEQVLGDFASMGLETLGGGGLADSAAAKAAQAGEKGGLTLGQRLLQGAKTGGKYGSMFGVTGAMQQNESPLGIAKSAAVGGATGAILGAGTEGAFGKRVTEGAANEETKKIDSIIGRIIQGDEKDIPKAKEALSNIDLKGIKTNKDLFTKLNDRVEALSNAQDTHLITTKNEALPIDKLTVTSKVGGQEITHNFVKDAIEQLKTFYQKTNDVVGEAGIKALEEKASGKVLTPEEVNALKAANLTDANYVPPSRGEATGLTPKEINDLAKLHGQELNAYNANGELASGLTKQAAENTRAGLKGTVRQLSGDAGGKASEVIDKSIHNAINTRDLIGDVQQKVNDLKQKVTERGFGEKAGRTVFKIIDKITGGGFKGFVQSFVPRGEGLKVMNSLDLERGLQASLKSLEEMIGADSEKTFMQKAQKFLQGAGKTMLNENNSVDNAVKEWVRNPKMGASVSDVTKNIPKDDLATMSDFTDYVAGSYKAEGKTAHQLELDASRIAEKYGLPQFKSTKGLANHFGKILEGVGYKPR